MPEKRWTEPSPSDFDRWEALVANGVDPSHAARQLGFKGSMQFKRTNETRHGEVCQLWRERQRADDRLTARETLRQVATDGEAPHAARVSAANTLAKASGLLDETQRVELTGPDGGPVAVEIAVPDAASIVQGAALLERARKS